MSRAVMALGYYPALRLGAADMYGIGRGRVTIDYKGRASGVSRYQVTVQGSIDGCDDADVIEELGNYFNANTAAFVLVSVSIAKR